MPRLDLNNLDNMEEVAHFIRALQGVNFGELMLLFLWYCAGVLRICNSGADAVDGVDAAGGDRNCEVAMRVDSLAVVVVSRSPVILVVVVVGVPNVS